MSTAEAQMARQDNDPDRDRAEQRHALQIDVGAGRELREGRREQDAGAGGQDGHVRRPVRPQPPQGGRRIAAAGEREQHSRTEIDVGVHAGQGGADDDEVHDPGSVGDAGESQHFDEGALRNVHASAGLRPGYDSDDDGEREDVEQHQADGHGSQSGRDRGGRSRQLARGDGDQFDPDDGEHADEHRHPHAVRPVREEPTGQGVEVPQIDGFRPYAEDPAHADGDEQDDRSYLDEGEPVFGGAEIADRARIQRDH